jgi:hypothetical protein
MQIQEITDLIIAQIEDVLSVAFGKRVKGFGLCIKNVEGAVVLATGQCNGEQTYIGIEDNKGTYFYVRMTASALSRRLAANENIGSCGGNLVTVPMKIVLVSPWCQDLQGMMMILQKALFSANLSAPLSYGQNSAKLTEKTFTFIPWDIFEAETGKEKTEFRASNLSLASIEFDLKYKTNYANCKDIKLC